MAHRFSLYQNNGTWIAHNKKENVKFQDKLKISLINKIRTELNSTYTRLRKDKLIVSELKN